MPVHNSAPRPGQVREFSKKSSPSAAGNRETEGDKRGAEKIYSGLGSAVYADYCAGNVAGHGAGIDDAAPTGTLNGGM